MEIRMRYAWDYNKNLANGLESVMLGSARTMFL